MASVQVQDHCHRQRHCQKNPPWNKEWKMTMNNANFFWRCWHWWQCWYFWSNLDNPISKTLISIMALRDASAFKRNEICILSCQGLWVTLSACLHSCLWCNITKGKTIRYLSIFEEKITLSEFYVPPIPAGANCNFSGPQWGGSQSFKQILAFLITIFPT